MVVFIKTRPKAEKKEKPYLGELVEVVSLEKTSRQIQLETHGIVRASERVILTPQISGVVNWMSDSFSEGNFFNKGDVLLTLEPITGANLNYTVLKAPFNGVVQTKSVDLGQYVNPGAQLATLIGSDRVEVHADLAMSDLTWLPVTRPPNQLMVPATISLPYGSQVQNWDAVVQRHLLELTSKGLMVQLVIEIIDPFNLRAYKAASTSTIPLFIGAFVDIKIPAKTLNNIFVIPSHALHDETNIWIAVKDRLEVHTVDVVYVDKSEIFISGGVAEGELLIVSPLKGAANGLKIRIEGKEKESKKSRTTKVAKRSSEDS